MRNALAGSLLAAMMICGPTHAADIAAGKAKAELCVGCHGENGISQMENIPSLAAQPDHVHPVAVGVLPRRHPQERADAAGRRAAQQRGHPQSRRLFRLARAAEGAAGRQSGYVEEGRAGGRGPALRRRATPTTTPAPRAVARVAGQRQDYLVKALHDYKSGVRSGGAMAAMASVAYSLSEEEIEALAHYLAHL